MGARRWWAAARLRIRPAQLSLAGSNNGSNLHVARNLFTYEDRVSLTKGRHQIRCGRLVPALASRTRLLALSQYGQATFTSLQTFLAGTVGTLLCTIPRRRRWAGAPGWAPGTCEDVDAADAQADADARLPR